LERLSLDDASLDEGDVAALLELPSRTETAAVFALGQERLPLIRIDAADLPEVFRFIRRPEPLPGERSSTKAPD
jgi:hypothetical protein